MDNNNVIYYNKRLLLQTLIELDNNSYIDGITKVNIFDSSINEKILTTIEEKRTYFIQQRLYEIEFEKIVDKDIYAEYIKILEEKFNNITYTVYDNDYDDLFSLVEDFDFQKIVDHNILDNIDILTKEQKKEFYDNTVQKINDKLKKYDLTKYPVIDKLLIEINNIIKNPHQNNLDCQNSKLRLEYEILNNLQTKIFGIEFGKYIKYPKNGHPDNVTGGSTMYTIPFFIKMLCGISTDVVIDEFEKYMRIIYLTNHDKSQKYDYKYLIYNAALNVPTKIFDIDGYKIVGITYKCKKGGTDHSVSAICYGQCSIDSYTLIDDNSITSNINYKNDDKIKNCNIELVIYENIKELENIKKKYEFMHGGTKLLIKKILKYTKKIENLNIL